MKGILEAIQILFTGIRKSDQARITGVMFVIIASVWIGIQYSRLQANVEKIPRIEKTLTEHQAVINTIPEMAGDVRDIKRILMRRDR